MVVVKLISGTKRVLRAFERRFGTLMFHNSLLLSTIKEAAIAAEIAVATTTTTKTTLCCHPQIRSTPLIQNLNHKTTI